MNRMGKMLAIAAIVGMSVGTTGCWTYIDQGNVGVKINRTNGQIDPNPLGPGWHSKAPFVTGIEEYPVKMFTYVLANGSTVQGDESKDEDNNSIGVNTVEGQHVDLDVAMNLEVDPAAVPLKIYKRFRTSMDAIATTFIRQTVRSSLNQTIGQDSLRRLLGPDKEAIRAASEKIIAEKLQPYGFLVRQFSINSVRPAKEIMDAISAQNQMKTAALTAQNALEKAKYDAEAKMIAAKATADANALLAQSMTTNPQLVTYKAIEKWDGVLPTMTGVGGVPFIGGAIK